MPRRYKARIAWLTYPPKTPLYEALDDAIARYARGVIFNGIRLPLLYSGDTPGKAALRYHDLKTRTPAPKRRRRSDAGRPRKAA